MTKLELVEQLQVYYALLGCDVLFNYHKHGSLSGYEGFLIEQEKNGINIFTCFGNTIYFESHVGLGYVEDISICTADIDLDKQLVRKGFRAKQPNGVISNDYQLIYETLVNIS